MSYVDVYVPGGLGQVDAEQRARNRQRNQDSGVSQATVGPGYWDDWLDAALTPSGIASADAGRVPGAVREVLQSAESEVDMVCWGGGSGCGGPATRGKIYVKWKPSRPYNAVTYADIVRNLFASAADQFAAGSRLTMHRYRVLGGWFASDKFVYPEGGAIPAGAPAAARRTTVETIEEGPGDLTVIEREMSGGAGGVNPAVWVAVGIGGTIALGASGLWWYQRRAPLNRRRRRRKRRTSR